jgi:hypothetical protein
LIFGGSGVKNLLFLRAMSHCFGKRSKFVESGGKWRKNEKNWHAEFSEISNNFQTTFENKKTPKF